MEAGDPGAPGLTAPGPVELEFSQQRGNATTQSKTGPAVCISPQRHFSKFIGTSAIFLETVLSQGTLLFPTDQSLEANTALGKGSDIAPVTLNSVRGLNLPFGRCCAVSLTQCLTKMSSTSGFLWLTHVSSQSRQYTIRYCR